MGIPSNVKISSFRESFACSDKACCMAAKVCVVKFSFCCWLCNRSIYELLIVVILFLNSEFFLCQISHWLSFVRMEGHHCHYHFHSHQDDLGNSNCHGEENHSFYLKNGIDHLLMVNEVCLHYLWWIISTTSTSLRSTKWLASTTTSMSYSIWLNTSHWSAISIRNTLFLFLWL